MTNTLENVILYNMNIKSMKPKQYNDKRYIKLGVDAGDIAERKSYIANAERKRRKETV